MQSNDPAHAGTLRRWLFLAGSGLILFHLAAVLSAALAAPSGPWPTGDGANMATPPQFAFTLQRDLFSRYLRPLRLAHNYHFMSNRPGSARVVVEAHLKDSDGNETAVVELPERTANPWVRHRQRLLAGWLVPDEPVPPGTEVIPGPGQAVPTVRFWEVVGPGRLKLQAAPQHLVPRDRPVYRPSDLSLLLVRSYARHLCRRHGAASVELVRRSRDPLPPTVLGGEAVSETATNTVLSNFGEFSR
jgi:hypothetical protein